MKKSLLSLMLLCFAVIGLSRAQETILLGNPESATTSYNVPYNTLYGYSFTEQLYTGDEIQEAGGIAGNITTLRFYHKPSTAPSEALTNNIVVYMVQTDVTTFSENGDYVPVTESDIVFEGDWTIPVEEGWVAIELETPFEYDGESGLMLAVHETTSGYASRYFVYTNAANTVSRFYSDSALPDPYDLDSYAGNKNVTGTRANVQMDIVPATGCAIPSNVTVSFVSATNVSLTWESEADNFNVEYKIATEEDWIQVEGPITTPSYILMFLEPETDYNVRIQAVCDEGASPWKKVNFTTPATCPAPTDLQATLSLGQGTVATLTWTDNGGVTDWQLCLNEDEENLIEFSLPTPIYMFTDLIPETTYTAKVRANCGTEDGVSAWSNTVTFTPTNAFEITVNDGTNTNGIVPIYGYWCDNTVGTRSQFIIPAEALVDMQWGTINQLTFYANNENVSWGAAQFEVYMKEVDYTNFPSSALMDWNEMDMVMSEASLSIVDHEMVVTLDNAYQYMGGNLLIGFKQTVKGGYVTTNWLGVSAVTYASIGGYNTTINGQGFLPKTTFTFTPGEEPTCWKPTDLTVINTTADEAILSWTSEASSWVVEYDVNGTFDDPSSEMVSDDPTITFTGLNASTTYYVRVKTICDDGESAYSNTVSFTTDCAAFVVDADNTFFESFEGDWTPLCWTTIPLTGSTVRDWACSTTHAHEGSHCAYSGYYGPIYLVMPMLEITGATALTFWNMNSYANDYQKSSVILLDGENEIELWSPESVSSVWEKIFINLSAYAGQTIKLAFKYEGNNSHGWSVDEVQVALMDSQAFTKDIAAYTETSGYYLIASPLANVKTTDVTNLVDGTFDFYSFSQIADADGNEWFNYKAEPFTTLESAKGYLYANASDVTLSFNNGTILTDNEFEILELPFDPGSEFAGLNLLGNPFAEEAYLITNTGVGLAYYRLNPANNSYVTVDDNSAIAPMEGVFYGTDGPESVIFSKTAPTSEKSNMNITVSQGRGVLDNAIIRFGEGNTLRKISFRDNSTKVYLPVNGQDYALVNANDFGEMPINFKAETNGTYTMSFSNQNVEFGYLHLIDNMTGAEVDLLANPTYSFEAKSSDYASRFKLVFATGNNSESSEFAFVSNGNIIVNGEGMLQVIDMTGRIVSTEQINGVSSINLNAAAGVYVLQLTNGNEVKTQKIVVK